MSDPADPTTGSGSPRAESTGDWTTDLRQRLTGLRLSPAREAEIIEELSQHLDDRRQELIAGGTAREEATRLVLEEFHADRLARYLAPLRQARVAEVTPPRGWWLFGGLWTDVRQAIRELRAASSFTAVALVVLTLGIGATTAIFSVVDAVVLRGLPFDEHDRLVAVGERGSFGPGKRPGPLGPGADAARDPQALSRVQPQNFTDWVAQQQVFESIAAYWEGPLFTMQDPGTEPEDLIVQQVTAAFFDVLRIHPALGRSFSNDNETDGRHRVAVLSDALWWRRFGGSPDVVGRTIRLNDSSYEVVGIMPPGVTYPVGAVRPADIWVPYVVPPNQRVRGRGFAAYLQVIARLKPGVTIGQAQVQMDQVAKAIEQANPQWAKGHQIGVRLLHDHLVGASTKSWMLMLLGAVAIVLLIACANVANLLLVRASAREREMAVRAALGGGRWRLVRQLMIESLTLSAVGTVLAIVIAMWAVQVLRTAMPEGVPRVAAIALDLRVLVAAAGLSLLTGLLFGIVPALQVSKPDLTNSLKEGAHGASSGRGRQRVRSLLVVAEVALAVVLLVGAALVIGSFIAVMRVDPGFSPDHVLTLDISPRVEPGQRPPDHNAAFAQILARLAEAPGVIHAAMSRGGVPFTPRMWINNLVVPGRTIEKDPGVIIKVASPAYHRRAGHSAPAWPAVRRVGLAE